MALFRRLWAQTVYWRLASIERKLDRNEAKKRAYAYSGTDRDERATRCSMGLRDRSHDEVSAQLLAVGELARLEREWQALDERRSDLRTKLRRKKLPVPPLGAVVALVA